MGYIKILAILWKPNYLTVVIRLDVKGGNKIVLFLDIVTLTG